MEIIYQARIGSLQFQKQHAAPESSIIDREINELRINYYRSNERMCVSVHEGYNSIDYPVAPYLQPSECKLIPGASLVSFMH